MKYDANGAIYVDEKGEIASEANSDVNDYIKLGFQRASRRQHGMAQRLPLA